MKRLTLVLWAVLGMAAARAEVEHRPMLVQGKTWYYIYNHFEYNPNGDGSYNGLYDLTCYQSWYTLDGDTVIDGKQYMKMYHGSEMQPDLRYYAAYREEDGKVYVYGYQTTYGDDYEDRDWLLIDFNMQYNEPGFDNVAPIAETISAFGGKYRRYRYQNTRSDGSTYMMRVSGVEGVGFKDYGLVRYQFDVFPKRVCDYETFLYVEGGGVFFTNNAFDLPKDIELTDAERQLVNGHNDFSFNLFRQVRGDASLLLSPLSITYALGMMNNGAAGQTQQEINKVLGFGETGASGINDFCRKMLTESTELDSTTCVSMANTVFVNRDFQLQDAFVQKANGYYDAQPQTRDFGDEQTCDVINQWASDHTEGMVPQVLSKDEFNAAAVSYLLNAIYFKGAWSHRFNADNTQMEAFNGGAPVSMMRQTGELPYGEDDVCQTVVLNYGNSAYSMTVLLPREGKTIDDVLAGMNGSTWRPNVSSDYEVDLKLPRFETMTTQDLKPVMSALGMPAAFDRGQAEFPHFCNVPVFIELMKQVARIKVDEQGTEAAAVTAIGVMPIGMKPLVTFHATRPFLYIISEQSTGAIFFMGQYAGDTPLSVTPAITDRQPATAGAMYNLQGQQLATPPTHGVYIKDGRKVVVR